MDKLQLLSLIYIEIIIFHKFSDDWLSKPCNATCMSFPLSPSWTDHSNTPTDWDANLTPSMVSHNGHPMAS